MESVLVQFKGQTTALPLPRGDETTGVELQELLATAFGVASDAQRVFYNKKRVEFDARTLRQLGVGDADAPPRIMLMASASKNAIEDMKKTKEEVEAEMRIRASRRVVSIDRRNEQLLAKEAVSTDYRFHAIEVLEQFPDAHRARSILEQLANDRGILAVMAKHKWSVGCLAEMYPDGKVGVDPVCVLGLNQNKGQKILLRLRTDDLQGFRKFLNIKKVLFHELTHNVHSEHDSQFYQLMRIVERECDELDWSNHGGRAVGGAGSVAIIPDRDDDAGPSGHRLGGGSTSVSRLLRDPPPKDTIPHEVMTEVSPEVIATEAAPIPEPPVAVVGPVPEPMEVENVEPTPATPVVAPAAPSPPQALTPLFDASFSDYQPSERELRMQRALERLRARYSATTVTSTASLLHKILSNIVEHSSEAKYRSIRKSNRLFQSRLAGLPECLEFLEAVGFEDQSESVVLTRNDPALLWIGRSLLDVLLSAASSQAQSNE